MPIPPELPFLYSWKWFISKTLDSTSFPLPWCRGSQHGAMKLSQPQASSSHATVKRKSVPCNNPPPFLNARKIRADFAHFAPKMKPPLRQLQYLCGVCKNNVLGKSGENPRELWPYPPPSMSSQVPSRSLGSFWEWEGARRRKPMAPGWDGLLEQTKSSGLFPPAPTQWKEFPAPAPGWKS